MSQLWPDLGYLVIDLDQDQVESEPAFGKEESFFGQKESFLDQEEPKMNLEDGLTPKHLLNPKHLLTPKYLLKLEAIDNEKVLNDTETFQGLSKYSNGFNNFNISSLQVNLRCQVFDSIVPDLPQNDNVGFLRTLSIDFEITSPKSTIHFLQILQNLQYCLSSLVLNLEFRYPFVFSYYGRQLIRLNYKCLTRTMAILNVALEGEETDVSQVMMRALAKLQNAILTEFNTLNVMKECDYSSHRIKLCREYLEKLVTDDTRRSIKCKAYCVKVLNSNFCV